ncbi:MAG: HEAT repeat domain-containing protein [Pirellulales bacterium]|nr:HEAT repeat domain-containing protein [Pirellulales bacterium]
MPSTPAPLPQAGEGSVDLAAPRFAPLVFRDWAVVGALAIWLTGIPVVVAVWLARYARFVRRLPAGRPGDKAWQDEWTALLGEQGVRRAIPLRVTARTGPLLCRLPREYVLLVPEGLWRTLAPPERMAILRHDLAHYQRADIWKSLAARILALPHWFNPMAWWAVRRFDEAAEWACDAAAVRDAPDDAPRFAQALLGLAQPSGHAAYSPAAGGSGLAVRIRRLLATYPLEDSIMKRLVILSVAILLVVACLVRVDLVAQAPVSESPAIAAPADEPAPPADAPAPMAEQPSAEEPTPPAPSVNAVPAAPDAPASDARPARAEAALASASEDAKSQARLKALYQQRVAVLREAEELARRACNDGNATSDVYWLAKAERLQAELDLCDSSADRIRILEQRLAALQQRETMIASRRQAGAVGGEVETFERAKAARLAAAITLEKERALVRQEIEGARKDLQDKASRLEAEIAQARQGAAAADSSPAAPPVDDLIATARAAQESAQKAYDTGTLGLSVLLDCVDRRYEAELLACPGRDQRLAVHDRRLADLKAVVAKIEALYSVGARGGESERLMTAKTRYLLAQHDRNVDAARQATPDETPAPAAKNQPAATSLVPDVPMDSTWPAPAEAIQPLADNPLRATTPAVPSTSVPLRTPTTPAAPNSETPAVSAAPAEPAAADLPVLPPPTAPETASMYDGLAFFQWKSIWRRELKPERRTEAVRAMAAFAGSGKGPEAVREIVEMMREYDVSMIGDNAVGKLKQAAINAFSTSGVDGFRVPPATALPVLCEELETGPRNGRLFAVLALGELADESADVLPALERVLRDEKDDAVRSHAFSALVAGGAKGDRIVAVLRHWVDAGREDAVVEAIAGLYNTRILSDSALLSVSSPAGGMVSSRGRGVELASRAGPIIKFLVELAHHERRPLRLAAIPALAHVSPLDETARKALLAALDHKDPATAQAALTHLVLSSDGTSWLPLPTLLAGTKDENPRIRCSCLARLAAMGPRPKEVLPRFLEALEEEKDPSVWAQLGNTFLAELSAEAPAAIPVLRRVVESHPSPEIRASAAELLHALESRPAQSDALPAEPNG